MEAKHVRYWIPLFLLFGALAHASEPSTPRYLSIQLENDLFANAGDGYYTYGGEISQVKAEAPPAWLDRTASWSPLYRRAQGLELVRYTLGQKLFTPHDIEARELVVDDRPYAGFLYLSAAVMTQQLSNGPIGHGNLFEVTVGVVGSYALGKELQTNSHRVLGNDMPRGWDNQLHNEPILGLSTTHFWRYIHPVGKNLQVGVVPHLGMSLGNAYTHVSAGAVLRLGNQLYRDLCPPRIGPGFSGLAYFQPHQESGWYLYLGMEGRRVLRDIFLDGNTFRDSHSVEKEPVVADLQFGIVWLFDEVRVSISNMQRSTEFVSQPQNSHYGALNLTLMLL